MVEDIEICIWSSGLHGWTIVAGTRRDRANNHRGEIEKVSPRTTSKPIMIETQYPVDQMQLAS
jgi:hypothetical protein